MSKFTRAFIPGLIWIFTSVIFVLAGPATAAAATFYVGNLNNSGGGSLRQAILDANANADASNTINFSVTGTITLTTGELLINKSLTINGPGVYSMTVSGNSASRVFNVNAGPVTIAGLTIQNGYTGSSGGGINNAGTLTVSNCTITNNTAAASLGGGINNGGTLRISGTTISSNYGGMAGGGINNFGTITMDNSTISSNTSPSYGAGINSSGILTIRDSSIIGNTGTSSCRGGGLLNSGGTVNISGSTISSNTSGSGGGGGITNDGASMTIANSTISYNSAPGSYGGGIRNSASLTIISSSITGNVAGAGLSGGIDNGIAGTVTITNSTISDNNGGMASGGIGNAGVMTISDSTINYNQGYAAAGIYTTGSLTMTNCTVTSNWASGYGGGLYHGGGTVTLLNCTIGGNSASSGGGGIIGDTSAGAVFSIRNTIVSNNGQNCSGVFSSQGHNLSDDTSCASSFTATGDLNNTDPYLLLFTDNGGWTMTHSLPPGSPAIDAADPNNFPATDQRGWPRPAGARADIGAVEVMASRLLTITKTGTGTGSVASLPGGINCTAGCLSDSSDFPYSGVVSLSAVPASGLSIFTGWSGAGCSDFMTMNSDKTCSAQFTLCGSNPVQDQLFNLYASITDAYNAIVLPTAKNLKISASNRIEDLDLNGNIALGLYGGYACDFISRSGLTYITGTMTISKGSVLFDGIAIL